MLNDQKQALQLAEARLPKAERDIIRSERKTTVPKMEVGIQARATVASDFEPQMSQVCASVPTQISEIPASSHALERLMTVQLQSLSTLFRNMSQIIFEQLEVLQEGRPAPPPEPQTLSPEPAREPSVSARPPVSEVPPAPAKAGGLTVETRPKTLSLVDPPVQQYDVFSAQQRLYILSQYEEAGRAYSIGSAWQLRGDLNIDRLEGAFREVIRRHDSLRTAFVLRDDSLQQQVWAAVPFMIDDTDLAPEEADRFVEKLDQPFDLSRPPLLRVGVVRLAPGRHLLVVIAHHTVFDGPSMDLLMHEVSTIYRGGSLPPLKQRYADFITWHQRLMKSSAMANHLAFWQELFADGVPVLNLPTDHLRSARLTFEGDKVDRMLDAAWLEALKAAARQHGVTLNMLLLGAFQVLLMRLSGQSDFCIAFPSARYREYEDFGNIIGMFANTTVMRCCPRPEASFSELLTQVKKDLLQVLAHGDVPFEALVQRLVPQRDLARNPIFDTMFVYEKALARQLEIPNLAVSPYTGNPACQVITDLLLEAVEAPDSLRLNLQFATSLFRRPTMERWMDYYQQILEAIKGESSKVKAESSGIQKGSMAFSGEPCGDAVPIGQIPILTPKEYQQLRAWNDTCAAFPADETLVDLFEFQVNMKPDVPAVVMAIVREPWSTDEGSLRTGPEQLSYHELNRRANQLAHYLMAQGVGADHLVGICVERSLDMLVGLLGILKAGGAYVPIDPLYPAERIAFMVQDARLTILLTQARLADNLFARSEPSDAGTKNFSPLHILCLDRHWPDLVAGFPDHTPAQRISSHQLAYVIYTSGSTGTPKGVMIPHGALANYLHWSLKHYEVAGGTGSLVTSSLSFDATITSLYLPLLAGNTVRLLPEGDQLDSLAATLREQENLSLIKITPAHLEILNQQLEPSEFEHRTRYIVIGGESLFRQQIAPWQRYAPRTHLINEYGPTETVVGCCIYDARGQKAATGVPSEIVPIGRPISNTQLYVLDAHLNPVGQGAVGEIYIGGAGLARGYLHRANLTQERFITTLIPGLTNGPVRLYKTGDLARLRSDGQLEYLGRQDQQVKLRGYRIELGEIEAALYRHPAVREAAVVLQGPAPHQHLAAWLTLHPELEAGPAVLEDLTTRLKSWLPDYMVPAALTVLEALPLTPNGKIDRQALQQRASQITTGYAAPRTELETRLAEVWQEVLGKPRIGIHDNYFALGGDSIRAIQMVSRLNRHNLQVTIADLLKYTTIARLAEQVTSQTDAADQAPVSGDIPLLPLQVAFFQQQPAAWRHHYNQSVLLAASRPLNPTWLTASLQALWAHHDALRCVYSDVPVRQINRSLENPPVLLEVVEIGGQRSEIGGRRSDFRLQTSDFRLPPAALEAAGQSLQESFDLARGPLLGARLFRTPQGDYLLLVVHHLIVDLVSWHILLDDLISTYHQQERGEAIQLAPKTASFQSWAVALHELTRQPDVACHCRYWQDVLLKARPFSKPVSEDPFSLVANAARLTGVLDGDVTATLLTRPAAFEHISIEELLLTAISRALVAWHGGQVTRIDLERHGRDSEHLLNLNVSRTVGWFTSIFPVILPGAAELSLEENLRQVRQVLRNVPHQGLTYGLCRWLTDPSASGIEAGGEEWEASAISFNYLGSTDLSETSGGDPDNLFTWLPQTGGQPVSPHLKRTHWLEIEMWVTAGQLHLVLICDGQHLSAAVMQDLLQRSCEELTALGIWCQSGVTPELIPADLTHTKLPEADLAALQGLAVVRQAGLEDVYPLTPMQEGLYFHLRFTENKQATFLQTVLPIRHALDVVRFESCWRKVLERHAVLRSVLIDAPLSQPVQVVLRQPELDWVCQDLRAITDSAAQDREVQAWKQQDLARGFDLARDLPLRIGLLRRGESWYELIFSINHIVTDGWSTAIIFKEFFELYTSTADLPAPPVPYTRYLNWLKQQDHQAAARFWKTYLQGYNRPVGVGRSEIQPLTQAALQRSKAEFIAGRHTFVLQAEHVAQLQQAAITCQTTLHTFLQAAWGILLARYNHTPDVVFGTVVSGRPEGVPDIERMVGLFINTIPVRVTLRNDDTIATLIQRQQEAALAAQPYHHYPLVEIQALSPLKNELITHVTVLQNYPIAQTLEEALTRFVHPDDLARLEDYDYGQHDLSVSFEPINGLTCQFLYNQAVYDMTFMQQLGKHLKRVLIALGKSPDGFVAEIDILSEAEKAEMARRQARPEAEFDF